MHNSPKWSIIQMRSWRKVKAQNKVKVVKNGEGRVKVTE